MPITPRNLGTAPANGVRAKVGRGKGAALGTTVNSGILLSGFRRGPPVFAAGKIMKGALILMTRAEIILLILGIK